jgi:methyltransferase (TIGR00027 family)
MAKAAAKTGMGLMALVAIEQYFPEKQRIIDDSIASCMVPLWARWFLWPMRFACARNWMVLATERSTPGLWGGMMCRKRYIDERITASVAEHVIQEMVNLGAGFDTRAFRLPVLATLPVWEIDQQENIKAKEERLRGLLGNVPAHIKLIAMDFDREDLGAVLASHGYSINERTFFVWEAVTQYLTEQSVRATFDFLATARPCSRLAFTYVRKDFIEGKHLYNWENIYKRFVTDHQVWIFGMEPEAWPDFLRQYGWRMIEDVGYDEMAEKYIKPTGRTLASTPIERMVYAEKL